MPIPDWMVERNTRFIAEREARDIELRANGFKIIPVLAAYDARTRDNRMCMWTGEAESLVILNPPANCLKNGIGCVIVGPDSEVIEVESALESYRIADERKGVAIVVFKGQRPR